MNEFGGLNGDELPGAESDSVEDLELRQQLNNVSAILIILPSNFIDAF